MNANSDLTLPPPLDVFDPRSAAEETDHREAAFEPPLPLKVSELSDCPDCQDFSPPDSTNAGCPLFARGPAAYTNDLAL